MGFNIERADKPFVVKSPYKPSGDQPQAIEKLVNGVKMGLNEQVLLGVTGSGKTFTMANVIQQLNRPTLVLAHNKTLAAQLCSEFREFFPNNAVEYFVSYYDYYQPEAYIAHTDTYIEKDSAINDEIERLRHSATSSLAERRDVIVVSSVSCIYGLGDPIDYKSMVVSLRTGQERDRDELMRRLTDIRYERNDVNFIRNTYRVRGDTVEIYPAYWMGRAIRVEFFGDEIDRISEINAVTGMPERILSHVAIYPASHYVASKEKMARAMQDIEAEMWERVKFFEEHDKLLEAQRIRQRTQYDLEMLSEIGFCTGIENYSRVIAGRAPGTPPTTLIDYFPDDFLLFVDESHVTLPQVRAMYNGDHSRKQSLVDYGFRLPSAYDNRPLKFDEFEAKIHQAIYVSATPGEYERERAGQIAEQVIRPTGLLDPEVFVRPIEGQIDDLIGEINDEMYQKIVENRSVKDTDARGTAQIVGLSAIKYGDLSNQASKDYVFDVERFTSFEGNTGPYILYTIVRTKSILGKYKEEGNELKKGALLAPKSDSEKALMLSVSRFNGVVENAFEEKAPHKICAYIYELANEFNHFYHETKILSEQDEARKASYLALLDLVREVLETCIDLLGFSAPERM